MAPSAQAGPGSAAPGNRPRGRGDAGAAVNMLGKVGGSAKALVDGLSAGDRRRATGRGAPASGAAERAEESGSSGSSSSSLPAEALYAAGAAGVVVVGAVLVLLRRAGGAAAKASEPVRLATLPPVPVLKPAVMAAAGGGGGGLFFLLVLLALLVVGGGAAFAFRDDLERAARQYMAELDGSGSSSSSSSKRRSEQRRSKSRHSYSQPSEEPAPMTAEEIRQEEQRLADEAYALASSRWWEVEGGQNFKAPVVSAAPPRPKDEAATQ
jgi:hypothetical protein